MHEINEDEMGKACSKHGGEESVQVFTGKPEGNRPLGRHRRSWEYNIKMELKEIEWSVRDWIEMV
jgi:hypothetical protein